MIYDDLTYDVFLSHSHEDAEYVEKVAQRLEDESSFRVWLDKWVLTPGIPWQQGIATGLNKTHCCAVFLGKTVPKGWFRNEIERALNRQAEEEGFRVLAVLLPGSDEKTINQFVSLRTWVDFRNGIDNEHEFHKLTCAIKNVAPGRGPKNKELTDEQMGQIKDNLSKIKQLLTDRLIDKEIAQEYQRKLLDGLIKV